MSGVLTSVVPTSMNTDDEQESGTKMIKGVKDVMSKFYTLRSLLTNFWPLMYLLQGNIPSARGRSLENL